MRITRTIFSAYQALESKPESWMSAPDLAKIVGMPRQNLNYALRQMVEAGVVERADVSPTHYRLTPFPNPVARNLIEKIKDSATVHAAVEMRNYV